MKSVAIIGTRKIEAQWKEYLVSLAEILTLNGIQVRTGGANGADEAAMIGAAKGKVENLHVFLPWASYNAEIIPSGCTTYLYNEKNCPNWAESVRRYHPAAQSLTRGPFALHARNYGIVMHPEPVDLVIALPTNSKSWGGTGQGMRVATGEGVPLINLRETGSAPVDELIIRTIG